MTATTAPTAAQITDAIAAMTPKGRETMTEIGQWRGSFFDGGIREHEGIWGECLVNEMGHKSSGVINRLRDLGMFYTNPDEEFGVWFALTALGAAVAHHLNNKEISMTENTTAKPAAAKKEAAAKKPAAKKVITKDGRNYTVPKGYEVKWQHGGHDLLRKVDDKVNGPAWFTACNAHGDLKEAASAKEAEGFGVLKVRSTWCKGDHKPAAKKTATKAAATADTKKAAAKAPAKASTTTKAAKAAAKK